MFASRKELLKDREVSAGASKYAPSIVAQALSDDTTRNCFNGWKLKLVTLPEDRVLDILEELETEHVSA